MSCVSARARLPGLDGLRSAAAHAARTLRRDGGSVAWQARTADEVRAVVEGTAFGAYDPGLFKRSYAERPELTLVLDAPADLHELARRQEVVARHLDAARDLANRPPNDLTPEALAQHARGLADDHLTVEAHGRLWIETHEMGAFAAVAAGSPREPQLICMRYNPPNARGDVTLGLVGKAVTFDSGGVSLEAAAADAGLERRHVRRGGGDRSHARDCDLGLPLRVLTVVAATENVQGGSAFKPGDILRASNGKTIEIVNTDAEGRLILADALHYARSEGATHSLISRRSPERCTSRSATSTRAGSAPRSTSQLRSSAPQSKAASSCAVSRCILGTVVTSTRTSQT